MEKSKSFLIIDGHHPRPLKIKINILGYYNSTIYDKNLVYNRVRYENNINLNILLNLKPTFFIAHFNTPKNMFALFGSNTMHWGNNNIIVLVQLLFKTNRQPKAMKI